MTTRERHEISFETDVTDETERVEINGIKYHTAEDVNAKLRDELLCPKEAGIDKPSYTSKLQMCLINFKKGLQGIVLCDVPGGKP